MLGHALSLPAIHGGKATHATMAAPTMAVRLRGGMLPQASGSPAAMRATRDLLRRRLSLPRKRAELLGHVQHTTSPDHRPAIGTKRADPANRTGIAERFPDPAVQKRMAGDLALIGSYAHLRCRADALLIGVQPVHERALFAIQAKDAPASSWTSRRRGG